MQMRLYSLLTEAIVIEISRRARAGRHLKPVLLKKKIDKSDPFFANYLRDATLEADKMHIKDRFLLFQCNRPSTNCAI